jgi:hypothetical protein
LFQKSLCQPKKSKEKAESLITSDETKIKVGEKCPKGFILWTAKTYCSRRVDD